jgi:hypothetical protein
MGISFTGTWCPQHLQGPGRPRQQELDLSPRAELGSAVVQLVLASLAKMAALRQPAAVPPASSAGLA